MINVVIPAAGEATRLRPLTNNCSKAMVRIHGKPAISYIIDSIYKNAIDGVAEIVIVDGKHDDIRDWLSKTEHSNISCIKQESLNGPRDAIDIGIRKLTRPELPLVIWLGDAIITDDDLPLGEDFLLVKNVDDHFSWCMFDGEKFYNKPNETIENGVALVGLYSFEDGYAAKESFGWTHEYDISYALECYMETTEFDFDLIHTEKWYDIGDISSYHKTCGEFLTFKARAFNHFKYDPDLNIVTKYPSLESSHAAKTIMCEKAWYDSLDQTQRMFVPKVLQNDFGLSLSYESGILLSDLFLNEDISNSTIDYLIEKVVLSIRKYFHTQPNLNFMQDYKSNAEKIWIEKTQERILKADYYKEVADYYLSVAKRCFEETKPVRAMHGDLHFGNIIYNPYNDSITLIDPRGEYGNHIGCGGDSLYDLCKLSHDLYHGYNAIVSNTKYPEYVRESFIKIISKYYPGEQNLIIDGGALLIASCIPLHYDDIERQARMENYIYDYAINRS